MYVTTVTHTIYSVPVLVLLGVYNNYELTDVTVAVIKEGENT